MLSGIYSARFVSNQNLGGYGVAVFSGNAIHGGDTSFYYRGKYKLSDKDSISGTIEVIKHSTLHNSIFGPVDEFKLVLNGIVDNQGEGLTLSGQIEGHPTAIITIELLKLDELIELD